MKTLTSKLIKKSLTNFLLTFRRGTIGVFDQIVHKWWGMFFEQPQSKMKLQRVPVSVNKKNL